MYIRYLKTHLYHIPLFISSLCFIFFFAPNVMAGGINNNEARVIAVAKGGFEYDGDMYIARQIYVDELIAYLNQSDINMTAEEADYSISQVYANIEIGVTQGYIVKVNSEKDDVDKDAEVPITEVSPEEEQLGIRDPSELEVNKIPEGEVVSDDKGNLHIFDSDGNTVASFTSELKDTGFSIYPVRIMIIILGVVLMITIVEAVKLIFAQKNANRS